MATLTLKERWVFSILLPICSLIVGYMLVLATTQGVGSSIGFRAIGALIALPFAVLLNFGINFVFVFPLTTSRSSSFWVGMAAPVLTFVIEYAYLWQIWKKYPDLS